MRKKILKFKLYKNKKAQTILELAVFGGIVLFLLGMIIRYAVNFASGQNVQYDAFREALKASMGDMDAGKAKRRSASLIWVEDKRTVEGGDKFGSSSRSPFVAYGAGSFTNLLQMPITFPHSAFGGDSSDYHNLPVMDIYINGQHFVFRTAGFKYYGGGSNGITYSTGYHNVNGNVTWEWTTSACNALPGNCIKPVPCNQLPCQGDPNSWWWHFSWAPELVFWTQKPLTDKKFCYDQWNPNTHERCIGPSDLTDAELDKRFDLRRDGGTVPVLKRHYMQWQWYPVHASMRGLNPWKETAELSLDVDFDKKEEMVLGVKYQNWPSGNNHWDSTIIPRSDIDEDHHWNTGQRIIYVATLDFQAGDIDSTYNTADKENGVPEPGIMNSEGQIDTYVVDPQGGAGAFLTIDQTIQGIARTQKSVQERYSVDVITRKIRLSNNTGCFCPSTGNNACLANAKNESGNSRSEIPPWCSSDNRSVEVACSSAGCCESQTNGNHLRTCLDFSSQRPILYVRTIVGDKSGIKRKTVDVVPSFQY